MVKIQLDKWNKMKDFRLVVGTEYTFNNFVMMMMYRV